MKTALEDAFATFYHYVLSDMILRFKTVALVVFKGFGQCRSKFLIVRFLMGKKACS